MTAIAWDDKDHWGNPATCVHLSSNGSDVPDRHSESSGEC